MTEQLTSTPDQSCGNLHLWYNNKMTLPATQQNITVSLKDIYICYTFKAVTLVTSPYISQILNGLTNCIICNLIVLVFLAYIFTL